MKIMSRKHDHLPTLSRLSSEGKRLSARQCDKTWPIHTFIRLLFWFHADIDDIWARVSCFIERQMVMRKVKCKKKKHKILKCLFKNIERRFIVRYFRFRSVFIVFKGVYISSLGTFTFSFDKVTPTFILTEKLCHTYGFKQKKSQCSGQKHRTNEKQNIQHWICFLWFIPKFVL